MLQDIRRSRRGQVLVLVALGMVAICGMMALAVDAGQLYFARRFMQNAVDAGALAGAQELVGTNANPTGNPASARYQAMQETFKSLGLTPTNGSGSSFYNPFSRAAAAIPSSTTRMVTRRSMTGRTARTCALRPFSGPRSAMPSSTCPIRTRHR
ncbi:MAG: hypothetical protein E6I56_05510 [Chloroflexi bacterium]|nr:MAG: hypothetical protein E6I56_05510 [Chloroflexota bacterium]